MRTVYPLESQMTNYKMRGNCPLLAICDLRSTAVYFVYDQKGNS